MRNPRQLHGVPDAMLIPEGGGAQRPTQGQTSGVSLMQIAAILRSYWRISLLIWVVATLVVAALLLRLPKEYTATATLVADVSSDNTLEGQGPQADRLGMYLAEQTELITSPVLLLPVVSRLGLTRDPEFAGGFRGDPRGLPSYVANQLSSALQVQVSPNAQLMSVSVTAADPTAAANIANAVVDQYFIEGRGRASRYAGQLTDLQGKVAAAQARLAAFRAQKGLTDVTDLSANTDTEAQALTALESKLLDAQNLRRSLEAREAGNPTDAEQITAAPEVQRLQSQLNEEQTELAQLRTIYGSAHPRILALQSQIATTRRALNAQSTRYKSDMSTELRRARALEAQYASAVEQQRDKVVQLRDLQGQGSRLQLELESAQSVYKAALASYEQAAFTSVDKFTSLRVISPASPPAAPTKTKKRLWLAEGSLAGLALGLLMPFGYEILINRRVRCRDDFERSLGVRVLAQIGPISPAGHA